MTGKGVLVCCMTSLRKWSISFNTRDRDVDCLVITYRVHFRDGGVLHDSPEVHSHLPVALYTVRVGEWVDVRFKLQTGRQWGQGLTHQDGALKKKKKRYIDESDIQGHTVVEHF